LFKGIHEKNLINGGLFLKDFLKQFF